MIEFLLDLGATCLIGPGGRPFQWRIFALVMLAILLIVAALISVR